MPTPQTSQPPSAGSRDGRAWPPPPPPHSEARSARRAAVPIQRAAQPPKQVVNQEAARAQNQVLDDGGLLLLGVLEVGLGEVDVDPSQHELLAQVRTLGLLLLAPPVNKCAAS